MATEYPYNLFKAIGGDEVRNLGPLSDDQVKGLRHALENLSPNQRKVLLLMYEQGHTQSEAGEIMGLTGSYVGQVKRVALRRLRQPFNLSCIVHGYGEAMRKRKEKEELEARKEADRRALLAAEGKDREISLFDIGISRRAFTLAMRNRLYTVDKLIAALDSGELAKIKGVGPDLIEEIAGAVKPCRL